MLALGALAGCGRSDPAASETALTRAEFIDVVVALRNAELAVARQDSADALFEAQRDSILAAHGTTPAGLHGFLEGHPDLRYQEALWDEITERLKRPIRHPHQRDPEMEAGPPPVRGQGASESPAGPRHPPG